MLHMCKSFLALTLVITGSSVSLACPASNFCVGDRVIDHTGYTGHVFEIFENERVTVLYDGESTARALDVRLLAKRYRCIETSICSGKRVLAPSGYAGTISEIFENGLARVIFDGSNRPAVWRLTRLNLQLNCTVGQNCRYSN